MYELPAEVRTYVDRLVADDEREFSITLDPAAFREVSLDFASTGALERSWEHGKIAAQIGWGTNGSMERCIRKARKVGLRDPGGYCATRHKGATGQWPTEGGKAGIPS